MTVCIERVELYPLLYPVEGHFKFFETRPGGPLGRASVVVKITASDGTVGWGEAVPSPLCGTTLLRNCWVGTRATVRRFTDNSTG
jgi:L-alanine-DL-glutamate epimerase-like enolase superfamily enzyme